MARADEMSTSRPRLTAALAIFTPTGPLGKISRARSIALKRKKNWVFQSGSRLFTRPMRAKTMFCVWNGSPVSILGPMCLSFGFYCTYLLRNQQNRRNLKKKNLRRKKLHPIIPISILNAKTFYRIKMHCPGTNTWPNSPSVGSLTCYKSVLYP